MVWRSVIYFYGRNLDENARLPGKAFPKCFGKIDFVSIVVYKVHDLKP